MWLTQYNTDPIAWYVWQEDTVYWMMRPTIWTEGEAGIRWRITTNVHRSSQDLWMTHTEDILTEGRISVGNRSLRYQRWAQIREDPVPFIVELIL